MNEANKGILMNMRDFMGDNLQKNFEKNYNILKNYCKDINREAFTEEEEKAWAFIDFLYVTKTQDGAIAHIMAAVIGKNMRLCKMEVKL